MSALYIGAINNLHHGMVIVDKVWTVGLRKATKCSECPWGSNRRQLAPSQSLKSERKHLWCTEKTLVWAGLRQKSSMA